MAMLCKMAEDEKTAKNDHKTRLYFLQSQEKFSPMPWDTLSYTGLKKKSV